MTRPELGYENPTLLLSDNSSPYLKEKKELITLLQRSDYGMIPFEVLEAINGMKTDKVKKIHTASITHILIPDRWQTYVKTADGRKQITANSERALFEKLYDFYFSKKEVHTLRSLYPTWENKRRASMIDSKTIRRDQQLWKRYYDSHKISDTPLNQITHIMIEEFIYEMIREFSLNKKGMSNMRHIISAIFKFACHEGYISIDPMTNVVINNGACSSEKKEPKTNRIYLPHEKAAFFRSLNEELNIYPSNTDCYAILLLFTLGLRIGELCALKWSDIDEYSQNIHIQRIQTTEYLSNGDGIVTVVDHVKKKSIYADRFLHLSEYELSLLDKVKKINKEYGYSDDNFIFVDENGRTKIREIDNRIRKICRKAGIPEKSAHDIRRTVASELFKNGVSLIDIKEFLGHADVTTTWEYIYSIEDELEKAKKIHLSLTNNMCTQVYSTSEE